MSEEGGRRFRLAKSVNEEDETIQNAIPPSTRYKTKWAVEVFREWQLRENRQVMKVMAYRILVRKWEISMPGAWRIGWENLSKRYLTKNDKGTQVVRYTV